MFKLLTKIVAPKIKPDCTLLVANNIVQNQLRTTFILKRKHPPMLHKLGNPPKKLRTKHHIYELVKYEDTEKQPDMDVILTSYISGLGNVGDKVTVKPHYAYNSLLLPGLAVYATPENIKYYENIERSVAAEQHSSPTAEMTTKMLERMTLSVIMSKDHPWVLKPWHIRANFRKCGYWIPEEAITMPDKEIRGPDMNIQNKEFYITITVNNLEKVNVRCRIHHWSTQVTERIQHVHEFWKEPSEPIFPEDAAVLETIPSGPLQKPIK